MAEEREVLERAGDLDRVSSMDRGQARESGMRSTMRDSPEYRAQRENDDSMDNNVEGAKEGMTA